MTNGRAPCCESLDEIEARSFLLEKKEAEKWKERRNGKLFVWVAPLKRYAGSEAAGD